MTQIILISHANNSLAKQLIGKLDNAIVVAPEDLSDIQSGSSYVYFPQSADRDGMMPDLGEARRVFQFAGARDGSQFVLISSALIYGTGPNRPPFVDENYRAPGNSGGYIRDSWDSLESSAVIQLEGKNTLTILRLSAVEGSSAFPARLFTHRFMPTLPGHDPVLQLLSLKDLAQAIRCVVGQQKSGTFNVAPDTVVPLHKAVRLAHGSRIPMPRTLSRLARHAETLEYLRYSWTISNHKIKQELGFIPSLSSAAAFRQKNNSGELAIANEPEFDPFGMDQDYIRFYGKTLFKFLSEFYWRIEDKGLEHIPVSGRGVLAGMHRGFMPFDGVMALHTIVKKTGRYPRFLTHPGLLKFPFLANFMTKLGGVLACQESADQLLENDQLLGIFPEGIHGAFTFYRDSYKLQAFGRDAFVKLALRHRAPIIPFVTVGSAEIFPIFGKIKSRRWTRYADWPFIPITPTFPLLPVPLPSKWHTQFLPPISVEQYPPEAAEDRSVVKAISRQVRSSMQQAVDDMLARRRSIFFGSIFERSPDESQSKPVPV
ncbi:MAG TPA: 1-acyl-sn-glycerol-3-phosphate acyltransferase [Candidatus Angelobacter sp.]|jgi:1-acyl-sn-glycerol-3-phosphate acyltransferase|nr:1-acyl-sn-glycerol-3-phosphate acyltransferase [Candidatus Angelobacter sp.]